MKRILIFVLLGVFLISTKVYAQPRGNASPATIELSYSNPTREITFPYQTRDLYIQNYDTTKGIWINFRGSDTNGVAYDNNGSRHYIGPSTAEEFYDYLTNAITIIIDNVYTAGTTASPITVIATY